MMRTNYKYKLGIADEQFVKMPQNARILTVQVQGDSVCLWAEVDTGFPIGDRLIVCYGTGHPIQSWSDYIGTVQTGPLVWHFYDGGYAP